MSRRQSVKPDHQKMMGLSRIYAWHRISEAPPALKGLMVLLIFSCVLAIVYAAQVRPEESGESLPPAEEAVVEPQPEKTEAPKWGICFSKSSCAELASRFNTQYEERADQLEAWEDRLVAKAEELNGWDNDLAQAHSAISAEGDRVRAIATKLVACASSAMEGLDRANDPALEEAQ